MDDLPKGDDGDAYRQVLGFLRDTSPELANELEKLDADEIDSYSPPNIPDYEPIEVIGSGGFGIVWLAKNRVDLQFYALKVLREGSEAELDGVREWKRLITYHDHLVSIGHVGVAEGVYYYVMPLADNAYGDQSLDQPENYRALTLVEYIQRNGRLSGKETVEIGCQIASGLQVLHEANAIHRDVKPANIMRFGGHWKLSDVGFVTSDADATTCGSRGYRNPSLPQDFSQDLHALAVTLDRVCRTSDPGEEAQRIAQVLRRTASDDVRDRFRSAVELERFLNGAASNTSKARLWQVLIAGAMVVVLAAVVWTIANPVGRHIADVEGNQKSAETLEANASNEPDTFIDPERPIEPPAQILARSPDHIVSLFASSHPESIGATRGLSDYAPRTWYVSNHGSDLDAGTADQEFKTIGRAVKVLRPGDRVVVRDGTYREQFIQVRNHVGNPGNGFGLWGDKDHITVIEAENPRQAVILGQFLIRGSWITIKGFRIKANRPGQGHAEPSIKAEWSHHIDIINNDIGPTDGGGILFNFSDWLRIIDNDVHATSRLNKDCHSGISVFQPFDLANDDSGREWGIEIKRNRSSGNFNGDSTSKNGGNGLACTDFLYVQTRFGDWTNRDLEEARSSKNVAGRVFAPESGYPRKTLLEGNVARDNGHCGIQLYLAKSVTVRTNRCENNGQNVDPQSCAELYVADSTDCSLVGNSLVSQGDVRTAIHIDLGVHKSFRNIWEANVLSNSDGNVPVYFCSPGLTETIDTSSEGTNLIASPPMRDADTKRDTLN